jgi:hypothetical protein
VAESVHKLHGSIDQGEGDSDLGLEGENMLLVGGSLAQALRRRWHHGVEGTGRGGGMGPFLHYLLYATILISKGGMIVHIIRNHLTTFL